METHQNKSFGSSPLLVLLLISTALFSGYLYFKHQLIDKKLSSIPTVAGVQAQVANNLPTSVPQAPQAVQAGEPPKVTGKDHIRGSINAKLILVEYSDFECPYCKQFHPTMQQVIKEYGDKVAWVYRHFPLPFHQNAEKEAEASECATDLGGNAKFWEYADKIFEQTSSGRTGISLEQLIPFAKSIGLDSDKFKACLDSGKYAQRVKDDISGGSQAGVNGTPGTIILVQGKKPALIPGALPFDQVKPLIDEALK